MDREMITQHLALAERHVAQGEQHILRQQHLIQELEVRGHDTAEAKALLQQFEDAQRLHIADCKRLRSELESE